MAEKQKNMKVLGFHFTKISGERNPSAEGKMEMKTDMGIKNMEKIKDASKNEILKIEFLFNIDYNGHGKIELEGIIFIGTDTKTIKDIIKKWEKKEVEEDTHMAILNLVMQKSSVRAFEIEDELGLPMHIKLPSIKIGKKE